MDRQVLLDHEWVATVPVGIFRLDHQGQCLYVNEKWRELSGMSAERALGEGWRRAFHPDDQPRFAQAWRALVGEERSFGGKYRLRRPDGAIAWVYASANPLTGEEGERIGYVGTITDITDLHHQQIEQETARIRAEQANIAKSECLANMSHEIRTPMNVVLGMAELLQESELSSQQRLFVDTMQHSGKLLLNVINDILDFSRMEAGQLSLNEEPFSPHRVVEETAAMMRIPAQQKGLALEVALADNLPECILGDPNRLGQILVNLLGNAVKFTEQGGITVRLAPRDGQQGVLCFSVIDTGIGIEPERQQRIFAPFVQADGGINQRFGGTGLGLTISQMLVRLMGGTIWLESRYGEGSAFYFTVPVREAVRSREPCAPDETPRQQRPLHILLAEDVDENRLLFEAYLAHTPHRVVMVTDGEEAVARSERECFDVVFMDVQMPRLDGYAASRAIRRREREKGQRPVPIIALSAHAFEGERERSLAAGCDSFLSKPISKRMLLEAIRHVPWPP
ncbi:MAG: response regulator [Magnetococcales bacterium]|nr:response regulator [Magnetococcales bacterium]